MRCNTMGLPGDRAGDEGGEFMPVYNAFLPCRSGSERVKRKNTREFCGIEGGLTHIKLQQLARVPELSAIIVSTNDPDVMEIARTVAAETGKRIAILERPEHLGTSQTRTDDLILHAAEIAPEGVLLWTHTTSPFCRAELYSRAIAAYEEGVARGAYDSLMSVSPIRSFVWTDYGPLNYDRSKEKWPRTQTLPVYYDVNSAVFICDRAIMRQFGDRIGAKPVLFAMDHVDSLEIDWEEDFAFAEKVGQVLVREGRSWW